jgi:hypothetical protein
MARIEPVSFYGGAITTAFTAKYIDVSNFRVVPDHQEVWTEDAQTTPLALICEINEYKSGLSDDACGQFFFDDLATLNGATSPDRRTLSSSTVRTAGSGIAPRLPPETPVVVVKGSQIVDRRSDGRVQKEVTMWLGAIRLPQYTSDILITLTLPHAEVDDCAVAPTTEALQKAEQMFATVFEHFEVKNWGLFGC